MKGLLVFLVCLAVCTAYGQPKHDKNVSSEYAMYVGKYEVNGFSLQVTVHKGSLVLVIPGAPLQNLIAVGDHKFKSDSFEDALFVFAEKEGKIDRLISESPGNSVQLYKVSDTADKLNRADSLLTISESTEHFTFLYSKPDSLSVKHIAKRLEDSYQRILNDFGLSEIPKTQVRVYPDKKSFKRGINFPHAPDEILATAFGKDDLRMQSPTSVGREDSALLVAMVTHEFTHCVHLNIDYSPNNPRWLWEGVANFEAGWFVDPNGIEVIKNKKFPPFGKLTNGLEYELGYVIIEAVKDIWSFDKVVELIKEKGDTQAVFQISQEAFEKRIYEHIDKKYVKR